AVSFQEYGEYRACHSRGSLGGDCSPKCSSNWYGTPQLAAPHTAKYRANPENGRHCRGTLRCFCSAIKIFTSLTRALIPNCTCASAHIYERLMASRGGTLQSGHPTPRVFQ